MNFQSIQLIVTDNIESYQDQLNEIISENHTDKYTDIERSEAHERLGTVQFYHGDFTDALKNLEASLKAKYIEHKSPRNIVLTNIMLASLYCRLGHFERAENLLSYSIQMSESTTTVSDLAPILLSNLAMIFSHQKKEKDSVLKAREAIISASVLYPKNSSEYLNYVRVLLSLYLKLGQYDKAESLLSESAFLDIERAIIQSGIKYAQGFREEAYTILETEHYNVTSEANSAMRKTEQERRIQQMSEDTSIEGYQKTIEAIRNDEEFHGAILTAMLSYNMSVISNTAKTTHFSDALQAMEDFVTNLRTRRYEASGHAKFNSQMMERNRLSDGSLLAPVDLYNDPYASCPWDGHPEFMSFDAYFYPVTVLSTLLAIKAENTLLSTKFLKGYEVITGQVPRDMNKLNLLMKDIDAQYKESVASIGITLLDEEPSVVSVNSEDIQDLPTFDGAQHIKRDDLSVVNEDITEEEPVVPTAMAPPPEPLLMNDSILSAEEEDNLAEMKDTDYPDLSLLKDAVQNYILMGKMQSGETINSTVVKATSDTLHNAYHINISNTTGQIVIPSAVIPASSKKGAATNKGRRGSVTPAHNKDDASSVGGGYSKKSGKDSGSVMSIDSNVTPVDKPRPPLEPYTYLSEKHDQTSMRSEILLLINRFGRDEASTWIQWALSNMGGLSLGIMGQSIPNPVEVVGFGKIDKNAPAPTPVLDGVALPDQFTHEVRKRLQQVDALLLPAFNGVEHQYENGVLETRVVVSFILFKVTVQLNMKEDAGASLLHVETLAKLLHEKYNNNESATYLALSYRYRYEYSEWCSTHLTLTDEKQLSFLVLSMLPQAKKYLKAVEIIEDICIRRDAFKKVINLYTEIGRIPQYNGGAKFPPVSMEQLLELSDEVIEANEQNNFEWLQMFGKLRAKQHMAWMKALSVEPTIPSTLAPSQAETTPPQE